MKPKFYRLKPCFSSKFVEIFEYGNTIKVNKCPKCGVFKSVKEYPLKVHFGGKGKLPDYYRDGILSVIDQKIQKSFYEEKLTGYFLRDIIFTGWFSKPWAEPTGRRLKISDDDLKKINNLKEIVATGRCGFLRHLDGTIVKKCDLCDTPDYEDKRISIGLSVDLDQWDGSDIFEFNNWRGNIIVTQKVKDLMEREKFTNMGFTPIEEIDFN